MVSTRSKAEPNVVSPNATTAAKTKPRETLKAFLIVGVMFPLHIMLGVLSVPYLLYQTLIAWSVGAWLFVLLYAPFYLYPAQKKFPGWKGMDGMWDFFDYTKTCPEYFEAFEVHGGEGLDPDLQYFVACHPHGTVIFQRMFWRSRQLLRFFNRDYRMLAASALFKIPIVRELSLCFGAVDASRGNCHRLLKNGVNVVVYPGGLDEANSIDRPDAVLIHTRSGFVRLAVQHGVAVLPVFVFGELDAVRAFNPLPASAAEYVKKQFRMSTALFVGRWGCTILPKQVAFHFCIGKAIPVTKLDTHEEGYAEEVARVYAAYKAGVDGLYETYRKDFGYEGRELVHAGGHKEAGPKSSPGRGRAMPGAKSRKAD